MGWIGKKFILLSCFLKDRWTRMNKELGVYSYGSGSVVKEFPLQFQNK